MFYSWNQKKPFECLNFIFEGKPDLSGGSQKPAAYDEKFYKSLSSSDKNNVLNMIVQKKINLQIQNYILLYEPDLLKIAYIVGFYYLADYCIKKDKIDEFKRFVDKHNNEFAGLKQCHIIMPQFLELYQYAYAKHQYDDLDEKSYQYKYISEHALQLCLHGYHKEYQFMKDKGFYFFYDADIARILKKQNPKIIELLTKNETYRGMNYLLLNNDEDFADLFKKGYEVTFLGIIDSIEKKKHPLVKSLEIFKYIPDDEKIDAYKYYMLKYHMKLVPSFIRMYGDQFQDDSPKSWDIGVLGSNKKIRQACDILGCDPDDYIDPSDDDDDDDDDEQPAKKATKSKQQDSQVYYYCKYCGEKGTSASSIKSGYCKRSPTKSHVPFKDDKRSKYYCQMCGYSNSSIKLLMSSSCSRSASSYHVLFMSPDTNHLSCMYCGNGNASLSSLVSSHCKKSPKGYHVPADGKKK